MAFPPSILDYLYFINCSLLSHLVSVFTMPHVEITPRPTLQECVFGLRSHPTTHLESFHNGKRKIEGVRLLDAALGTLIDSRKRWYPVQGHMASPTNC